VRALAGQYVARHGSVEKWAFYFFIEFWPLRRLGLDPLNRLGRLAGGLFWALMVLLPALILTAITGHWADAPLLSWTVVAVGVAGVALVTIPLYRPAIVSLLSWLWAIVDEEDLRRLIAWDHRWYSHRLMVPLSGTLTLGPVLPLYFLALHGSGVPAGTISTA
jgi:hypothetical protein